MSSPAPVLPSVSASGGAQSFFGLLLLATGVFGAWLFATGRLDAVAKAIATTVADTPDEAAAKTNVTVAAPTATATYGGAGISGTTTTTSGAMPVAQASGFGGAIRLAVDANGGLAAVAA